MSSARNVYTDCPVIRGSGCLIKGGVGTLELFDSRLTSKGNEPIVAHIMFLALATAGTCIACARDTADKPK
jgi:hypothetical protein